MKNKIVKDALILFAITLVAGLLLGTVYEITKAPRAKQEEITKTKAYKEVFSDASTFENVDFNVDEVSKYIETKGLTSSQAVVNEIVKAKGSEDLGYVITVTDNEGYGGAIKFSVGIKNDGTVSGVSILSISETAGLGMKAKEPAFRDQFKDKNVDKFEYTKTGKTADNQIDAISGATITSNAMTNGTNAALYCFQYLTGGAK